MAPIYRTEVETQSGLDRIRYAEGLIRQLPATHDGRNTWLLNYGQSDEAKELRAKRGMGWDDRTQAAPTIPPLGRSAHGQ